MAPWFGFTLTDGVSLIADIGQTPVSRCVIFNDLLLAAAARQ
ncbi:hypothetical protein [Edaphovirga cremea]|nr:hypothetical protein [Edaphovirga cremea]